MKTETGQKNMKDTEHILGIWNKNFKEASFTIPYCSMEMNRKVNFKKQIMLPLPKFELSSFISHELRWKEAPNSLGIDPSQWKQILFKNTVPKEVCFSHSRVVAWYVHVFVQKTDKMALCFPFHPMLIYTVCAIGPFLIYPHPPESAIYGSTFLCT